MPSTTDDFLRLRDDHEDDRQEQERHGDNEGIGTYCLTGYTDTLAKYPTAINSFYWIAITSLLGPEIEGGPATETKDGTHQFAYNRGTALPPPNSKVELTGVPYRWTFRWDGPTSPPPVTGGTGGTGATGSTGSTGTTGTGASTSASKPGAATATKISTGTGTGVGTTGQPNKTTGLSGTTGGTGGFGD